MYVVMNEVWVDPRIGGLKTKGESYFFPDIIAALQFINNQISLDAWRLLKEVELITERRAIQKDFRVCA